MRQYSKSRAAIEKEYRKVKAELWNETFGEGASGFCTCCGFIEVSFSHRIRRRYVSFISRKDNLDILCTTCADHVEQSRFYLLDNLGFEILEWFTAERFKSESVEDFEARTKQGRVRIEKMKDRANEEGVDLSKFKKFLL